MKEKEFKESSRCSAMVVHTWVKHRAQTQGQDSPCHADIVKVAPACPRAVSELAKIHALQSQANGNYRAFQRDAGGPELEEDAAKTAGLDLTSKHEVEKHDYYPLLGTSEAHLEFCVLFGPPQYLRQRTGEKGQQDM